MQSARINVVLVGLGFGAEFVPIYRAHPYVDRVAICDTNETLLADVGARYGISCRFNDLRQVIASDEYDAVHLVTPIPLHATQTIAVLESGKHCACTVPMATSIEDLRAIVWAQRAAKTRYMMMETAVYTREFLYVKALVERGIIGEISFLHAHTHLSFLQGGGHGGSHPHLVHEFVKSIVEDRDPAVDAVTAAQWTAAGICAHESAMKGGDTVLVPTFTKARPT